MIANNMAKETMMAVTQHQYGGPEVLSIDVVQKPTPKKNEILVRVYAVPVTTAGSFMREGMPFIGRLMIGLFKPKKNITGVGFSGEIEAVGEEVKNFQVGDKVFGETLFNQGTHAEYVCMPEDDVIERKPKSITHAEAAPICDGFLTSMNFLTKVTTLKSEQQILIIGASGSLGSAAVQIASKIGATVTGVCSTPNVSLVKSLGASEVIDYKTTNFTTSGKTYDVIYDTLGISNFKVCKSLLSKEGVYMSPVLDLKLLFKVASTALFSKKRAKFSATGMVPRNELKEMLAQLKSLFSTDKLTTVLDRKYNFELVQEAATYVDTGRKKGNVVLVFEH